MKSVGNLIVTAQGDCEIVMVRVFDAPQKMVFDAFTQAHLLKRWFNGPSGWSLVVCEPGSKPGDTYRYVWQNQNGTSMGMGGRILEFTPPERMVVTEKFDDPWHPGETVGTMVLSEQDGQTTLTQTLLYESREIRDAVLRSPMEQGVAYGYDRLAEVLDADI